MAINEPYNKLFSNVTDIIGKAAASSPKSDDELSFMDLLNNAGGGSGGGVGSGAVSGAISGGKTVVANEGAALEPGFLDAVKALEDKIGVQRNALLRVMKHESRLKPYIQNPITNATGLIQFMPATATGLGTSINALKRMTGMQQLAYVEKYFKPVFGKAKVIGDLYMYTFLPAFVNKPDNFELARKGSTQILYGKISKGAIYSANPGFDTTKKGYYTVGDIRAYIEAYY